MLVPDMTPLIMLVPDMTPLIMLVPDMTPLIMLVPDMTSPIIFVPEMAPLIMFVQASEFVSIVPPPVIILLLLIPGAPFAFCSREPPICAKPVQVRAAALRRTRILLVFIICFVYRWELFPV